MESRDRKVRRRDMLAAAGAWAVWDSQGQLGAVPGAPPQGLSAVAGNIATDGGGSVQDHINGLDSPSGAQLVRTTTGLTVEDRLTSLFADLENERYVHPNGDDTLGNGTSRAPFKTVQRAYDDLPRLIERQATIWLMSGTVEAPTIFNANYLEGSTDKALFPCPAVLFARGRAILTRTQNNAGTMSGGVVIKPTGVKGTAIIEGTASLTYWAYIEACQIAFQNVVFRAAASMASGNGCVVHRGGAYGHFYDCDWLARGFSVPYAVFTEAGGFAELTGLDSLIDGCSTGVGVSMASNADVSGSVRWRNCPTCLNVIQSEASIQFDSGAAVSIDESNTTALNATLSEIRCVGRVMARLSIKAPIILVGSGFSATYTDISANITSRGGFVHMNSSNWHGQWTYSHTAILLQGANSYTAPATESAAQQPLRCEGGFPPATIGAVNIVPAAGGRPQNLVGTFGPAANNQTLTPAINIESYQLVGLGGNRTGCTLGMSVATFEGAKLSLVGTGSSVEIVSSATCDIPAAGLTIGNNVGNITGASFVARAGRWRLIATGSVR